MAAGSGTRLLWAVERDGWLLLGFEHVAGGIPIWPPITRPATAGGTAHRAERPTTPCPPVAVRPFADRWHTLINPELVDGDTLLHTDMTPGTSWCPNGAGAATKFDSSTGPALPVAPPGSTRHFSCSDSFALVTRRPPPRTGRRRFPLTPPHPNSR
ncbi:hypothetical protein NKG94_28355 [Micromonospora sp. M12]